MKFSLAFSLAAVSSLTACMSGQAKTPTSGEVHSSGQCGIESDSTGAIATGGNELADVGRARIEATARIDSGKLTAITVLVHHPRGGKEGVLYRGTASPRVCLLYTSPSPRDCS